MAQEKKSFLLYADVLHTVKHLSKEQAGKLFLHLLEYVNDLKPETTDPLIKIAFEPIKQSLKRDLRKWETKQLQRTEAGRLGGLARAENARNEANQATAKESKQNQANQAVSVSGNVSGNVTVIDINKKLLSEIDISDVPKELQEYFKIAVAFQKLFISNLKEKGAPTNNPSQAKFGAYVNPIRLMIETDKISVNQINQAYDFLKSKEGNFWKPNILSTSKLREKIDMLISQKNSNKATGPVSEMNQKVRDKLAKYD